MKKGSKQLVAEAKAAIREWTPQEAMAAMTRGDVAFIDVREPDEQREGMIPGAEPATRGMLEWYADPTREWHKPVFASGKTLVVYCGGGGRAALACKTLIEMGIENVVNLQGGYDGWKTAEGPTEVPTKEVFEKP